MNKTTNYEEKLINSLTDKGAIINGIAISNEELSNNLDLLNSLTPDEVDYLNILIDKQGIKQLYKETKDWRKAFKTYVENGYGEESFIDAVEKFYKVKIKDAKHLKELTGITQVKKLERTLIRGRYFKYMRALKGVIKEGGKYKDLLEMEPKDFGLPGSWSGCLTSDKDSSILWTIKFRYFNLVTKDNKLQFINKIDLESIAEDIQAPNSVIQDCDNLTFTKEEEQKEIKKGFNQG